jgi:hypothetical protein
MKLFKKNIAQTNLAAGDKAAGWIANGILKVQNRFANVLGKMSATWKTKQQLIFIFLITIVLGGLSVMAIIKPFNKKAQNNLSKPAAIKIPMMLTDENDNQVRITYDEIKKIQVFKQSLDSAKRKKLLMQRPGLMDSLEMVEQLYYSQKK